MKKSKEFIIERKSFWPNHVRLNYLSRNPATTFCYRSFVRFFSVKLKVGEKKRIKITIEEKK